MPESLARPQTRILVIDDEAMVGRTIARILRSRYNVAVVTTAEEAIQRLKLGESFDVIICDYALPGMNGPQFRDSIAELAPEYLQRMFFASGATPDHGDKTVPWLEKPFTQTALIHAIEDCLARCDAFRKAV